MKRAKSSSLIIVTTVFAGLGIYAAEGPPLPFTMEATVVHQFETDLDTAGAFSLTRYGISLGWTKPIDRTTAWGLEFEYELDDYSFDNGVGVLGTAPWGEISTVSLGASYFKRLDNGWNIFLSPEISSSSESSLDGDSFSFSIAGGAQTQVAEGLNLGFGLVVGTGLEEVDVIPFVTINWEITETLTLQNPFRPGPTGPAGLELEYATDDWSASIGAAYRSWRFRIDGAEATAEGIADYSGLPVFARFSWELSGSSSLNFYGGALFGGEIEIENEKGDGLGLKEDVDTAPFIAISFASEF
jgi:hypothetical protein